MPSYNKLTNFNDDNPEFPWYALRVKSRFEKITGMCLSNKGYETFVPLYRSRRQWSDRIVNVELPLFAGYIFCRFDLNQRLPILTTTGLVSIVGCGANPVPIPESEVDAIRAILNSGLATEPHKYLQTGQTVRIDHGPLHGVQGILLTLKKNHRLVVSVTLLQRSVAVDVDSAWVAAVDTPQPAPNVTCPSHQSYSH